MARLRQAKTFSGQEIRLFGVSLLPVSSANPAYKREVAGVTDVWDKLTEESGGTGLQISWKNPISRSPGYLT